jgi:hypothetical protein
MKKIILILAFLFAGAVSAFGQSTTVSGQVTDSGGQSWNNGTFTATFVPNPQFPVGPYTWTGGTLNTTIPGTLNGTGAYSVSIPSNTAISPQGSQWQIQFVPNATSSPFLTAKTTITGATQTLNATPPDISINLQNPPGPFTTAYADDEIATPIPQGAEYFNTTSLKTRVWNGSAWANQGAGAVGACPGGANTNVQFNDAGACAGNSGLTYDKATNTFTATPANNGNVTLITADGNNSIVLDGSAVGDGILLNATSTGSSTISFTTAGGPINFIGQPATFVGATSGSAKLGVAAVAGTPNQMNLPTITGSSGQVLSTNGANPQQLSWITPAAAGANTALSNLAAVAVNTALLPGVDNSIALGSSGFHWTNLFSTALNCGIIGTTSCVISGNGSTSGTATLTWPAVAGTSTNPVTMSNVLAAPSGSNANAAYSFTGQPTVGLWQAGGIAVLQAASAQSVILGPNASNAAQQWIADIAAFFPQTDNSVSIGKGGARATNIFAVTTTFNTIGTATNCASSGGTCGSAAAGRVSIAAGATTVTVATTAVTANSEILVQEDSSLGTALSVTCNTGIVRSYAITTRTAATSFVITASAAPITNPACLNYSIVN